MVSFTRQKMQEVVDEKTFGIEFMNAKEAQDLAQGLSDIFEILRAEELERAFLMRDEVRERLTRHRDLQAEAVHIVETTIKLFEDHGHKEAHSWLRWKTRDEFRVTDQYCHFGDDVVISWRWKSEEEKKKTREEAQAFFNKGKAPAEAKIPAPEKGPATSTAPPSQEAEPTTTKQSTLPPAIVTGNRKRTVVELLDSEDDHYDDESTSAPKRSKPLNKPSKIVKIKVVKQDEEDNTEKPRRLLRAATSRKGHNTSIPYGTGSQISTQSAPNNKTLKGQRDMPRELKDKHGCTQWIPYSELYHDEKIFAFPPGDPDRGHFILRCNMGMCNNPLFFTNPLLFSNGKHHFERHGFSYAERNAMEDMIHDFGWLVHDGYGNMLTWGEVCEHNNKPPGPMKQPFDDVTDTEPAEEDPTDRETTHPDGVSKEPPAPALGKDETVPEAKTVPEAETKIETRAETEAGTEAETEAPTTKPASKKTDKQTGKPARKPASKTATKTANKTASKTAAKTASKTVKKPAKKPAAKRASKQTKAQKEAAAQDPVQHDEDLDDPSWSPGQN